MGGPKLLPIARMSLNWSLLRSAGCTGGSTSSCWEAGTALSCCEAGTAFSGGDRASSGWSAAPSCSSSSRGEDGGCTSGGDEDATPAVTIEEDASRCIVGVSGRGFLYLLYPTKVLAFLLVFAGLPGMVEVPTVQSLWPLKFGGSYGTVARASVKAVCQLPLMLVTTILHLPRSNESLC